MQASVFRLVSFVVAASAGCALADQPPLLNLDSGTLTTGGQSAGAQDVLVDAVQRGVTASGATRVASPFGWALNADHMAVDEVGGRTLGPIDLVTGAVTYADTQLALPAVASWPIGISYTSTQSGGHSGGGYQGNNWFQSSQPSVALDKDGVVRLFYAANAFVEYKQIDSTSYYAGINGAGGVLKIDTVSEGSHTGIELYTLHDQAGNEIVFFGFAGLPSSVQGQIWKYTVAKGALSGAPDATAYVGDATLPYTAATTGYSGGLIGIAFDSAGRKFTYTYTSIGGVSRLTSVTAKDVSLSSNVVATAEYGYYGDSVVGSAPNNGSTGDLAYVRVTLPTSFPAAGSLPAIADVRENRFYYDSNHHVKLIAGYEGTRQHLVATAGSSPVAWNANATTLAAALNNRAELRVTYNTDSPPKVNAAWFAGMDGSGADSPAGEYDFTYDGRGTYTPAWETRAVVKLPAFTHYTGVSLSSPVEASASTYLTQYFDKLGQPLSSVASDIDPTGSTGTPKFWITGVIRDTNYRLKAVHTPTNCSAYVHALTSSSEGSFATDASNGLLTYFERSTATDGTAGMVVGVRRGSGIGSGTPYATTNYVSFSSVSLYDQTLSSGPPVVAVHNPILNASRVYPVATTNPATTGSYNETNYAYSFFGSTIVPQWVKTTLPAISAANNGAEVRYTRQTWFSHLGQPIVNKMPNNRLDDSEYDSVTGQLVAKTTDALLPKTGYPHNADLPTGSDAPATVAFAGESTAYELRTEYTRDNVGRVTQAIANPAFSIGQGKRVSQTYYTCLSDRRLVRIDVPVVDDTSSPVYVGPVSLSAFNHVDVAEETATLVLSHASVLQAQPSEYSTTVAPRNWLAAPGTLGQDRLAKAQSGGTLGTSAALTSLSVMLPSPDGSRVVESRRYTAIPTSGDFLGSINTFTATPGTTHYDRALARYNGVGLVERTQDFTNTIERPAFDSLGRVVQRRRGTNDSGTSGVDNMHPYSSLAYDSTDYSQTGTNLNVPAGNGQVTQAFEHPSGSYNPSTTDPAQVDSRSYIRYDQLGNPVNYWHDGGPFLASTVDNLDRVTAVGAFDGTVSGWNTTPVDISGLSGGTGSMTGLLRYAQSTYDERGQLCRLSSFAVNPTSGALSTTTGDTVTSNIWRNPNGLAKASDRTQSTLNRICQTTVSVARVLTPASGQTQVDQNVEQITADYSHTMVVSQTNTYYDPTHTVVVATVNAQRGSANVTSSGIDTSAPTGYPYGPLIDVPNTSQQGWLGINRTGSTLDNLELILRSGVSPSRLILDVNTTKYDGLLMVPREIFHLGDPLRKLKTTDTPDFHLCCGLTGCSGEPYISPVLTPPLPFIQEEPQYDPRLLWCKMVTTDVESGEITTVARRFDPAGQLLNTLRMRSRTTTAPSNGEYPTTDQLPPTLPEGASECCGQVERVDNSWDKGRIFLERMFLCEPVSDSFNPLSDTDWSGCTGGCSKDTSYGYDDLLIGADPYPYGFPTDFPPRPNNNHLRVWDIKPIGGDPGHGWHVPHTAGDDDGDWYVYDFLGRKVYNFNHAFRKTNFGDGNAASGTPAQRVYFGPAMYPTEIRTPSGDHLNPWEHQFIDRDPLGRPRQLKHLIGPFVTPSSPTYDDVIDFGYDKFGLPSLLSQTFNGMFPSGCSGTTIDLGILREGTPQQDVHAGHTGNKMIPWQGPRVTRQTLPGGGSGGLELGMAYFPNPAGTNDGLMYPSGTGGYGGGGFIPLLIEPRFDWALGRPMGIYQGNSTNHYDTPVSQYAYLGMYVPAWRFMPGGGGGLQQWEFFPSTPDSDSPPTGWAPGGRNSGGGMIPLQFHEPDWRHRVRDDPWWRPITVSPSTDPTQLLLADVEGHRDIRWIGNKITSYLDRATSPDFGSSGLSPISGFTVNGHDEFYRHDCNGRLIYWLSGQANKWNKGPAETAWKNGLSPSTSYNGDYATAPAGVIHADFRWPTAPSGGSGSGGGCSGTGPEGGWLIAPSGEFNTDRPLSPIYPNATRTAPGPVPGGDEWAQHSPDTPESGCSDSGVNSRTYTENRQLQPTLTSTPADAPNNTGGGVKHHPVTFDYDAAGNVKFDGRQYYHYDGHNRLKDVYDVAWGSSGNGPPTQGWRKAHFDYDVVGQMVKAQYDTNGSSTDDLSDEDTEWTPRDMMGRPLGIWRQPKPVGGTPQCAKPYQVFGYHNTGFRGEGSDDSRGILDAPAVRWRDTDNNGTLDETVQYLQDFRGDVQALVHQTGGDVAEHVRYGPTGYPEAFPAADVNFDGIVDKNDDTQFDDAITGFDKHSYYDPRADLDRDGKVGSDDQTLFDNSYAQTSGLRGLWKLSSGTGLVPGQSGSAAGLDNRFGWRGYWYDPHLQQYHVRNRVYDPRPGSFLQTDPMGFDAGDQNLYRYADGQFSTGYDPLGLIDGCRDAVPGRPELGQICSVTTGVAPAQPPADEDPCARINMQIQNLNTAMARNRENDGLGHDPVVNPATYDLLTPQAGTTAGGIAAAGREAFVGANLKAADAASKARLARSTDVYGRVTRNGPRYAGEAWRAAGGSKALRALWGLRAFGALTTIWAAMADWAQFSQAVDEGDTLTAVGKGANLVGDTTLGIAGVWIGGSVAWTAMGYGGLAVVTAPVGVVITVVAVAAWAVDTFVVPAYLNHAYRRDISYQRIEEYKFMKKQYERLQNLAREHNCGGQ